MAGRQALSDQPLQHYPAPGQPIDELQLVPARSGATVAWAQSWTDQLGQFHSVVMAADLSAGGRALSASTQLTSDTQLASGLSLRADVAGDQLVAWRQCDRALEDCAAYIDPRAARALGLRPYAVGFRS